MRSLAFLMSSLVLVCLSGCGGGEHQDIKQWMDDSSKDMKGGIPPLPELKPFPIVSYTATDMADPFSVLRLDPEKTATAGANQPDMDRPREQLESFPLESMDFIGVINKLKNKERRALIKVDGVVYQVAKGNYMGQNFGRIVEITDNEIVLKEIAQDPSGQTADWIERQTTLQLQEGTQGKESKK
jgi:type IV pilus assembly protein PilP